MKQSMAIFEYDEETTYSYNILPERHSAKQVIFCVEIRRQFCLGNVRKRSFGEEQGNWYHVNTCFFSICARAGVSERRTQSMCMRLDFFRGKFWAENSDENVHGKFFVDVRKILRGKFQEYFALKVSGKFRVKNSNKILENVGNMLRGKFEFKLCVENWEEFLRWISIARCHVAQSHTARCRISTSNTAQGHIDLIGEKMWQMPHCLKPYDNYQTVQSLVIFIPSSSYKYNRDIHMKPSSAVYRE